LITSTHSVEPTKPNSSAAQLQNTRVRRGLQPVLTISPKLRTISKNAAVPPEGSIAPKTQASLWFPNKTYLSAKCYAGVSPISLHPKPICQHFDEVQGYLMRLTKAEIQPDFKNIELFLQAKSKLASHLQII